MSESGVSEAAVSTVSVRQLCEFAARTGDLDLRFTPAPTAQQGREGHQLVARRRGAGYESEVALSGQHGPLRVRGRADGFDPQAGRLEEVKTFRGALSALPANHQALHWAQLKVYGWLMCESRALESLTLALVYLDIRDQSEHPQEESWPAGELRSFFADLCARYLHWAQAQAAHRSRRDQALQALNFPQAAFRPGQRELATAVYRAANQGAPLLARAPTGIGKTIGTLFPALRAMPERGLDKLFFLTARTTGRQVALDALRSLPPAQAAGAAPALRVLELRARERACEHKDKACHGDDCPLARGFFDRLPQARAAAADVGWLDQHSLRTVALAHGICPYYLGQEMARWADVVVGDYNHYFDRSALLHALMIEGSWRASLLVDEAHNLYDRACAMYSADLTQAEALSLRQELPTPLRMALDDWLRQWPALADAAKPAASDGAGDIVESRAPGAWRLLDSLPEAWLRSLQRLNSSLGEHLQRQPAGHAGPVLAFYFRSLAFAQLVEVLDAHTLCELDQDAATQLDAGSLPAQALLAGLDPQDADFGMRLTLRNVVPAPFVAPRLRAADSAVLFSATLHPLAYHVDLLGLPAETAEIDVPTPFHPDQLRVLVHPLSTRRHHRERSLQPLVEAIAQQYRERPGNYLAFFSSYDYLQQALQALRALEPGLALWSQARAMDEHARAAFLARFTPQGSGIGFAVLGGPFAEGVDLPGRRLIGAFVATLGLPPFDQVHAATCERLEQQFGRGHDYTYVYPGLQRVVQAAGRVIRTESDTGTVLLLDQRYQEPRYRERLPSWWRLGRFQARSSPRQAATNSAAPEATAAALNPGR